MLTNRKANLKHRKNKQRKQLLLVMMNGFKSVQLLLKLRITTQLSIMILLIQTKANQKNQNRRRHPNQQPQLNHNLNNNVITTTTMKVFDNVVATPNKTKNNLQTKLNHQTKNQRNRNKIITTIIIIIIIMIITNQQQKPKPLHLQRKNKILWKNVQLPHHRLRRLWKHLFNIRKQRQCHCKTDWLRSAYFYFYLLCFGCFSHQFEKNWSNKKIHF